MATNVTTPAGEAESDRFDARLRLGLLFLVLLRVDADMKKGLKKEKSNTYTEKERTQSQT